MVCNSTLDCNPNLGYPIDPISLCVPIAHDHPYLLFKNMESLLRREPHLHGPLGTAEEGDVDVKVRGLPVTGVVETGRHLHHIVLRHQGPWGN